MYVHVLNKVRNCFVLPLSVLPADSLVNPAAYRIINHDVVHMDVVIGPDAAHLMFYGQMHPFDVCTLKAHRAKLPVNPHCPLVDNIAATAAAVANVHVDDIDEVGDD